MATPPSRPKPPLLAFLTALIFACTLAAVGLSLSTEEWSFLLCGALVGLVVSWSWVALGREIISRAALVLSLSGTLLIGRIGWAILPGNWLVLVPLIGGGAAFSYLFLRLFLGSLVELLWALSLPVPLEIPRLEIWRMLLYTRVLLTDSLIWRVVSEKLQLDGSVEAVNLLALAVSDHPSPAARALAWRGLAKLSAPAAIDTVCTVWAKTRDPDLAKLLIQKTWRATASAPAEIIVLTRLLLGEVELLRQSKAEWVPALGEACLGADPLMAERAAQVLQGLENSNAKEALCRLVSEQENPPAQSAALSTGYLPRQEQQRALFLLMTEQWERYASHDFDRRLMHLVYLTAPETLRQRIREKLRRVGRIDFLPIIAGEHTGERAAQFTAGESEVLTQTLIANRDWAALWPRVFDLPFHWSVRAVSALAESGWKPAASEEQALLAELASLAANGLQMEPAEVSGLFPLGLLQATARVPGRINAVAFAPTHPTIAVGTGQGKVVLWNYQTARRERLLKNFQHSIGQLAFSPSGSLFCAERTNGSAPCSIYAFPDAWQSETSFVLGAHEGSVSALAPVGSSQVLSAGSDRSLVLWDAAARQEIRRQRMGDWPRSLQVSPDETQLLLLRRGLSLLSLPGLEVRATAGKNAVFKSAAFAPDGEAMFAGTHAGQLFVYRKNPKRSDLLAAAKPPLTEYPPSERVEAVVVLKRLSILVSVGTGGEIRFFSLDGNQPLGSLTVPDGQITSLNVSPDEAFLAVGSAGAKLTLWDLRTLEMRHLLEHPLAQTEVTILPSLNVLLSQVNLSDRARLVLQFAQAVLHHRFRFTIELGEAPSIALGEFDIELEG